MPTAAIFSLHLLLGYVPWLFCLRYFMPRLRSMDHSEALRVIAVLHSFRFFGLVFVIPGVVGPLIPADFATLAAYGDFATGMLAILALLTFNMRPLFMLFVVAFNLVGATDIVVDYYHGSQSHLPELAGQLGAAYAIPVIYVPLLMITHFISFYLLARPAPKVVGSLVGEAA